VPISLNSSPISAQKFKTLIQTTNFQTKPLFSNQTCVFKPNLFFQSKILCMLCCFSRNGSCCSSQALEHDVNTQASFEPGLSTGSDSAALQVMMRLFLKAGSAVEVATNSPGATSAAPEARASIALLCSGELELCNRRSRECQIFCFCVSDISASSHVLHPLCFYRLFCSGNPSAGSCR
jgi:hypothetical protein